MMRWLAYREEVIALIVSTRDALTELYASDQGEAAMRAQKTAGLDAARAAHDAIAAKHEISSGFTGWFAGDLNNARLGSVAAYNSRLAAFIHILDAHERDFPAFFLYIDKLAGLDHETRELCLDAWTESAATAAGTCPERTTGGA